MSNRNIITAPGTDRTFHRMKVLAVVLLAMAMAMMAVSSVNVALPSIQLGLGATDQDLQWVLAGYALAFGVTLIPAGRAGDVLGRGSWFVVGTAIFTLASLACGLAPNSFVLNLARLAQGIGAGVFSPQITGMIQQYFSGGGRAKAFAAFGLTVSASVAAGPIIAGAIIDLASPETGWRWAFFAYLPIGLATFVLALLWFPFAQERERKLAPKGRSVKVDLDPIGSGLLTAAVLCLMYPFMAKQAWAWGLLVAAPVLLIAWWKWERRYARIGREPLVDLELFRYRSYRNALLVSGSAFMGFTSTFAVIAIFLQTGLGVDALTTGLVGLPNALLSAFMSIWTVRFVMKQGREMVVIALLTLIVGIGSSIAVVRAIGEHDISFWWLAPPLALFGAAMGAFNSANQTLSMLDVPVRHGGTAGGLKQTVERITTALGNAVITGIFFAFAAAGSWTTGVMGAFTGIGVCILIATGFAVFDQRQHARR